MNTRTQLIVQYSILLFTGTLMIVAAIATRERFELTAILLISGVVISLLKFWAWRQK